MLSLEEKRKRRNAYMRRYYQKFKLKHGVSSTVKWRREHPEEAKKHREREAARWWREPDVRQRHKAKGAEWRFKLKIEALDAYGGCRCACCGEQEIAFLTLDHVDNDGAAHRRKVRAQGLAGLAFYSYLRARKFPKRPRLQVLCYNCNCGKRMAGVCPHQQKSV